MQISDFLIPEDLELIKQKNLTIDEIEKQAQKIKRGIPPVDITAPATYENKGIKKLNLQNLDYYQKYYKKYKSDKKIVKFVPASGAATRMFKDFFAFLNSESNEIPQKIKDFYSKIKNAAFYDDLIDVLKNNDLQISDLLEKQDYKTLTKYIVSEIGLNYGSLPKALIKFHSYPDKNRTAFEEHLTESGTYASSEGKSRLHFTVSPEHKEKFIELENQVRGYYEQKFNTKYLIEYSEQQDFTDSLAFTPDYKPFRKEDGSLLFRPGGHGSLIYNLNDIDADLIFIKNIDNVAPDRMKEKNCKYKRALAGVLLEVQKKIFDFIRQLSQNNSQETIAEAFDFLKNTLSIKINFDFDTLSENEKTDFLIRHLDRPLRVCGMVKNEGQPGGGPFFVKHSAGIETLQIVEQSQIDNQHKEIFDRSTHFNPVDIVISPKRFNGDKYNLMEFVNENAGFIVEKNYNGRPLIALERPGLWNGAMADWNTIFIEVPIETFNPVKTVFDLLNPVHSAK